MQWTGERNGEYRGTFVTADEGMYAARVEATRAGKPLGAGETHVRAAPGDAEYFDATMHAARLRRIAEETGGKFYTPETLPALAEDLKYTGRGVTTVEERDLWHMPIVLLLIGGLAWRRVGLPAGGRDGVGRKVEVRRLKFEGKFEVRTDSSEVRRGEGEEGRRAELQLRRVRRRADAADPVGGDGAERASGGDRRARGRARAWRSCFSAGRRRSSTAPASWGVEKPIYLAEKPDADPKRVTGRSTKEEIVKAFDALKAGGGRRRRLHRA